MNWYVGGKVLRLPTTSFAKGGEAEIYKIAPNRCAKIFKDGRHPDVAGDPGEVEKARKRLDTHQRKLPAFPKNLPPQVIVPLDLIYDHADPGKGKIGGYTMELLPEGTAEVLWLYGSKKFVEKQGVERNAAVGILRNLHSAVAGVHGAGVVLGDFNPLNILVTKATGAVHLIDADSFQYGGFNCLTYTEDYVDPLLCDPALRKPVLARPYNADADWFAFAAMTVWTLLFVHPYRGIHEPKNPKDAVEFGERSLKRISVFNPEVGYPRPALPFGMLPDDLLQHLVRVFEKDRRGEFPRPLLDNLRWTSCTKCNTMHARNVCPHCFVAAPVQIVQQVRVNDNVTATRVFMTRGKIVTATVENNTPKWVYWEDDAYRREGGESVVNGPYDPDVSFRISGRTSYLAKSGSIFGLAPGVTAPARYDAENFGTHTLYDANDSHLFWLHGGFLYRSSRLGPEAIGQVLQNGTRFWVGPKFGMGFYRAGNVVRGFVFDSETSGINDSVQLPRMTGQILAATCTFGHDRVWLSLTLKEGVRLFNRVVVISRLGKVEGVAEADDGDGTWLGTIGGACATGSMLFVPTDQGLARVELIGQMPQSTKAFDKTAPFVNSGDKLLAARQGIYVVNHKSITLLVMK